MDNLNEEELAVLILLTRGKSISQIATRLRMCSVKVYGLAGRMSRKIGAWSSDKAAVYGREINITQGLFA